MSRDKTLYREGALYGLNGDILLQAILPEKRGAFVCPYCGEVFECTRSEIRGRTGCVKCQRNNALKIKVGDVFGRLTVLQVLEEWSSDNRRLFLVQCSCAKKTVFKVVGKALLSGNTKSCGRLQKEWAIKKNKQGILDLSGQRIGFLTPIERLSSQKGKQGKWLCRCDCGNYTEVSVGELRRSLYGDDTRHSTFSCGCAAKSVGEKRIKNLLDEMGIEYQREKSFNDCVNPKTHYHLRYDFYLPQYNCCIEYDGSTHFFANGGWNTEENFLGIKERDAIKNTFCLEHNIKLVRIPYFDLEKLSVDYLGEVIFNGK